MDQIKNRDASMQNTTETLVLQRELRDRKPLQTQKRRGDGRKPDPVALLGLLHRPVRPLAHKFTMQGRTRTGGGAGGAFRTHLVPPLAVCSALARPWPPADGTCGLCPSSETGAPCFGRLVWPWEVPGLSFELSYQCEPPGQGWLCARERALCSGRAAWK